VTKRAAPLPLEDALARLLEGVRPVEGEESAPLAEAPGRILAEPLAAVLDVPPFDNSAMDGYAVRSSDAGELLPVSARFAAGDAPGKLPEQAVARIFTGAPVPAGADAVVMQEDVQIEGDRVRLPNTIAPGENVRARGQDSRAGDELLPAGRRLRPQDLGLAASQGIAALSVRPRLQVALLSTGSELAEPGEEPPGPGGIYNSNRPMLAALLHALGCEVVDLGRVEDTLDTTKEALERGAVASDLIISSGGVSVGEADYVRDAVVALGEIDLWKVAIKPGKPFAKGRVGETPFMGLPGNPASAFVTFLLLARPWIFARQGRREADSGRFFARADFEVESPGSREEYLRVSLRTEHDGAWVSSYRNQSSGVLRSITGSNALARIPIGATVSRGDLLEVLPLDLLLS
jgi:molybdopterin molybdotransferase